MHAGSANRAVVKHRNKEPETSGDLSTKIVALQIHTPSETSQEKDDFLRAKQET